MKMRIFIILLTGILSLCGNLTEASTLLIDDYSSDSQYNTSHLNDLGGYTGSGIAMEHDLVSSGILTMTWIDPSVHWYSYTSSDTLLYTDMSAYTGVEFYMKGENGGEQFSVYLYDNNSGHEKRITLTNSFSRVFVPFSSLSYAEFFNSAKVTCIEFNGGFSPDIGTIYIDNISAATVPEADSIILFCMGVLGIGGIVLMERRKYFICK